MSLIQSLPLSSESGLLAREFRKSVVSWLGGSSPSLFGAEMSQVNPAIHLRLCEVLTMRSPSTPVNLARSHSHSDSLDEEASNCIPGT